MEEELEVCPSFSAFTGFGLSATDAGLVCLLEDCAMRFSAFTGFGLSAT